jgi:hypothetical protein
MNRANRLVPTLARPATRTIASLIVSALASALAAVAAAATSPPPASPPAEVARVVDQLAGTWSAKDILGQVRGKPTKSSSQVQCEKIVGGWGLRCRVEVDMGTRHEELVQLLAWDKPTGEFHLFSVNDSGDSHDHRGTFDGTTLRFDYQSIRDGKPFVEHVSLGMKGPKELLWKDVCTLGGEVVFSGEGLYRK